MTMGIRWNIHSNGVLKMKAMAATAFGDPDVLKLVDVSQPAVGPQDILIEVDHAALNPVDTKIRRGYLGERQFPLVGAFDVSGVVKELGASVSNFKVGDEVYACGSLIRQGGATQYIAVDARTAAIKPRNLTHAQAAALPLVTLAAWESLHTRCHLHAGQTVLIHAGGGGVGHIAIQLAKIQGAKVITTASSESSLELCRKLGADVVINYKKENFVQRVNEVTSGKGCHVVLETVGDATFNDSLECLAINGQLVTILGPDTSQLSKVFRKNATIHFEFMGVPVIHNINPESHGSILSTVAELVEASKLMPHVSRVVSLEEVPDAHKQLETGSTTGKIVVKVK